MLNIVDEKMIKIIPVILNTRQTMKKSWFLFEVWKMNRRLFYLFLGIIVITFFTVVKKTEATPFFVWSHYSAPHTPESTYPRSYLKINGEFMDLVKLPRSTREMIQIPIEQYIFLLDREFKTVPKHIVENRLNRFFSAKTIKFMSNRISNSEDDVIPFMEWLARYSGRVYSQEVKELEIGRYDIRFIDGNPVKENFRVIDQIILP